MTGAGNRKKRWYDWLGLVPTRVIRILLILSVIPISIAVILGIYAWRANDFDLDEVVAPLDNCIAYDCKGRLIGPMSEEARLNVKRGDLPDNLVRAFIAREDEEFYNHRGIVYLSMIRSMMRNVSSWSFMQGGSTITMQLARNTYELKGKTIDRKILEMAISRRIESKYSKDTILTAYLNRIYFGQGCYGIAQAARTYFNKQVKELNLEECAMIAGLVRGPSIFNPLRDEKAAMRERNDTLDRMQECRFISKEDCARAKASPLHVCRGKQYCARSYPILWISREFERLCGEKEMDTSSIFTMTSLDLDIQRETERRSEEKMRELEASPEWKSLPKRTDDLGVGCLQVAALCLESQTGNMLSVVGGRCPLDGIDRWDVPRLAGKLFLPIVNVAAADHGANIIHNTGIATGKSVGYRRVIELARAAGLSCKLPSSEDLYEGMFNASLRELVMSCVRLQQRGKKIPLRGILQVATNNKALVFSSENFYEDAHQEVLPREATRIVMTLPPFRYDLKSRLTSMLITLPNGGGMFAAVMGRYRATFVWVGFDKKGMEYQSRKGVTRAMSAASQQLAEDLFAKAQEGVMKPKKSPQKESAEAAGNQLDQKVLASEKKAGE
ncbi:MAG: transglycosylase domain-containing protein [Akkermansia sp.]